MALEINYSTYGFVVSHQWNKDTQSYFTFITVWNFLGNNGGKMSMSCLLISLTVLVKKAYNKNKHSLFKEE